MIYLKRFKTTNMCKDNYGKGCYWLDKRICRQFYDELPCLSPNIIYRQVTPSPEVRMKYENPETYLLAFKVYDTTK